MKVLSRRCLREQSGFTLVEVLASITILSIILIGVSSLLSFTNQYAVSNNERLVTVNLGKATIERVQKNPKKYINLPTAKDGTVLERTYTIDDCENIDCEKLYQVKINNKQYDISLLVNQSVSEKRLKLINLIVYVELDERMMHHLEGYISYEINE